jgi:transglutaminase-like putative cysteine protease
MTNVLPDAIRRLYTDPGEYIDSDHPAVRDFASTAVAADAGDREKASLLYKAVRDGIRYNPYVNMLTPETFRASSVLAAGNGYPSSQDRTSRRAIARGTSPSWRETRRPTLLGLWR